MQTNLIYRKEQLLAMAPAHLGSNQRFNMMDMDKLKHDQ
jgi:hypothetical protein